MITTAPFGPFPLAPVSPVISATVGAVPRLPSYPAPGIAYPTMVYWPYPSPPVSPSSPFYPSAPAHHIAGPTSPHHTIVSYEIQLAMIGPSQNKVNLTKMFIH